MMNSAACGLKVIKRTNNSIMSLAVNNNKELLMSAHNVCFLQEITKISVFGQVNFSWTSGF